MVTCKCVPIVGKELKKIMPTWYCSQLWDIICRVCSVSKYMTSVRVILTCRYYLLMYNLTNIKNQLYYNTHVFWRQWWKQLLRNMKTCGRPQHKAIHADQYAYLLTASGLTHGVGGILRKFLKLLPRKICFVSLLVNTFYEYEGVHFLIIRLSVQTFMVYKNIETYISDLYVITH